MSGLDLEFTELVHLEFSPPCECSFHDQHGADLPAEYVVWFRRLCCSNYVKNICQTCLDLVLSMTDYDGTNCHGCGGVNPMSPAEMVYRVERIDGASRTAS